VVDQSSMMLNELSVSGGALQCLSGRKWVNAQGRRSVVESTKWRMGMIAI